MVFVFGLVKIWHIKKQLLHDRLLYSFCSVRDAIALKAIKGEIDEDSEVFRFFYLKNSELIHIHKKSGLCFSGIGRSMVGRMITSPKNAPIPAETKRLLRQLRHSDDEIKQIAGVWINAMMVVFSESLRGI